MMTADWAALDEQSLAHTLLIELLTYQFASPVKWIDTQDAIFGQQNAKRIIEIGASNTLGTMAKRTLASRYRLSDASRSIRRQVLTLAEDEKQICYELEMAEEVAPVSVTVSTAVEEIKPLATPTPATATATTVASSTAAVAVSVRLLADAPVTAVEVIRALIAKKLKKPLKDIPLTKSIKELVGGKSTLQNELIGDLGNEFGNLPENPEDTSLEELGILLQINFQGDLGKQTSSLVGKMISTKMPGGFNTGAAKKYLEAQWGLGPQRQQGVLLLATSMQPTSRFDNEAQGKAFFDEIVQAYAMQTGIDLAANVTGSAIDHAGSGVMVDSAAIETITREQNKLSWRQFEILAAHLKIDLRAADRTALDGQDVRSDLQTQLDLWTAEHGETYGNGIMPKFSALKTRIYDSAWNWAREDVLSLHYDLALKNVKISEQELTIRKNRIINRATHGLTVLLREVIERSSIETKLDCALATKVGVELLESCSDALSSAPVFKSTMIPTRPHTTVDSKGVINYFEIPREAMRTVEDYVQEMSNCVRIFELETNNINKYSYKQQHAPFEFTIPEITYHNQTPYRALKTLTPPEDDSDDNIDDRIFPSTPSTLPHLHLRQMKGTKWEYSSTHTSLYLRCLDTAARSGLSFQNKTALLTGTGAGSIGAAVLEGLISGGARVIATTSSFSPEVVKLYRDIYTRCGSREAQLIVLPFNQGSKQDVEGLVDYIYNLEQGKGWDLDYIVPFAAISEKGNEIDNIDSRSELAHRVMLTNLLRLLGSIKRQKRLKGYVTRPSQVLLPLSPNHGTFGGDGLYSESKMALETLFNKWRSESWGDFLTICGVSIGWTRGTGLMSGNNIIAEDIEKLGSRTFSQEEMALNILGLMTPLIKRLCEIEPVYADLTGSMDAIPDLQAVTRQLRKDIAEKSETRKALTRLHSRETTVVNGGNVSSLESKVETKPRSNMTFDFPQLPDYKSDVAPMGKKLEGMVDLERVVVVVGFSELGPWGNSRTRWEMEAYGKFSLEGCIEMAWIMGLIKHHNGPIKGSQGLYSGWIDSKTESPVDDEDVKSTYEKYILEHTGIRLLEPELLASPDHRMLQEVVVQEDLEPFETSMDIAQDFKRQHGEKAEIFPLTDSADYSVRLKSGATIMVPKVPDYDDFVAAQIPTGWDARRYGVSDDIVSQVDRVTLYALVCTAEALLSAGVLDPYEFYQYIHVSEVGNCLGSGFGGGDSLKAIYKDRTFDKPVQNDILQETFVNTIGAWVNMLLISSSGPLKTPVGACATAIESIDLGHETIINGQAKMCLVGAADTYGLEAAVEFTNMKATSNVSKEFEAGRVPKEMSRPTTTTRNGFLESEGSGVQVITTAKLALDMGLPIYGIVALTGTASDKIGRSVPAPGQGILTIAREEKSKYPSPLLDIDYRREQLGLQLQNIKQCENTAISRLQGEKKRVETHNEDAEYLQDRINHIERNFRRQESNAIDSWGNSFWKKDPSIAPLRGALAVWGLTIDDLDVVSLHGTSTVANDKNEAEVISKQLQHLGRRKGNVILGICQKYLTGHPKGPAGAWMFNGGLQVLNTGLVPGNRNADNVDEKLQVYDLMMYPSRSLQIDRVKAFMTSSFGFGQKSAQAIGVHPRYLFATLGESIYDAYKLKAQRRQKQAYRHSHRALATNTLFRAKEEPPYTKKQESEVLLSPNARAHIGNSSSFSYSTQPASSPTEIKNQIPADKLTSTHATQPAKIPQSGDHSEMEKKERHLAEQLLTPSASGNTRVGIDIEDVEAIDILSEMFIARNFSPKEQAYCQIAPSPQQSFACCWSAKKAVSKSLGVAGKGARAAMSDIEITNDANGGPLVTLHGDVEAEAKRKSLKSVGVSISHTDKQVIAIASSMFDS